MRSSSFFNISLMNQILIEFLRSVMSCPIKMSSSNTTDACSGNQYRVLLGLAFKVHHLCNTFPIQFFFLINPITHGFLERTLDKWSQTPFSHKARCYMSIAPMETYGDHTQSHPSLRKCWANILTKYVHSDIQFHARHIEET